MAVSTNHKTTGQGVTTYGALCIYVVRSCEVL